MMGRCMMEAKGIGEVAGIEMPETGEMMTTKTREAADVVAEPDAVKKRKISDEDLEPPPSLAPDNSGGDPAMPEECASQSQERCHPDSSLNIDEEAQASCCSGYENSIVAGGEAEIADLEQEESTGKFEAASSSWNSECADSGKTTPSREHDDTESDELGSNGTPPPPPPQWPPSGDDEVNSRLNEIRENMPPSDAELEDFFTPAEQEIQKRFEDKYNFDVVNDKPLEGRYEWVQSMQPYNEDGGGGSSLASTSIPKKVQ